ncbi:aldo-keto reductase [Penicillium argentinense]|uniref:D-xylose reductase [NAD(P)H] n=1 Tax=Penicillium argentinense TaxID=1131581 RepID=A0A9W9JXW3_9EURO|nr:aldo-keto reductase [Penicillium argentinense]KAJ5085067.1 aldo-keto reductase [Penicillium argentinense]
MSMATPTHFKLNTGAQIPAVGLGTWRSEPGQVRRAVSFALKNGYSHIDAALIYGNEHEVGQGIKDSGVSRENIFITSKLWNTHQPNVAEGLQKTLDALGTDYLDLYLIHWPVRLVPNESSALLPVNPDGTRSVDRSWDQSETWRQMEEVYKTGKVKAIGVANWSIPYLEELKKKWTVVPAVNQVELHPFLPQHALKEWCDRHGILLEAYSPLGSEGAPLMSDPAIQEIAKKYDVSPATVLISYHVNRGVVVLPKSTKETRILSNKQVISLSREHMDVLDGLAAEGKAKRINTPLFGCDLGFDDWYNQ